MSYKSEQGRSKKQYENNAKIAWYSVIGMIVLLIIITLFGGCATTKTSQDKCCDEKHEVK
tara:strand:+ start:19083 stop:19262 length:180 start_codon:yes stop_codon:yes gene_type:complete